MINKLKYTSLLLGAFTCINASAITLDDIDFSNKIENQDLLYAPVKGTTSNRGAFWYKDIQQKVIGPANAGWGIKRITIRAFPNSHNNNAYADFVSSNNVIDIRNNLLPADAILCEASDILVEKLKGYGVYYNLQPTAGNYPGLCSLQLKYQLPDETQESELVDFISKNKVIKINYKIGSTNVPPVVLNVPNIITALVNDSVMTFDQEKAQYIGEAYKVLFQSSQYANSLYRDDAAPEDKLQFSDWKRFIDLYEFSTSGNLIIDQSVADKIVEIPVPGNSEDILTVNF